MLLAAVLGISVSGPLARLSAAAPLAIAAWRLGLSVGLISIFLVATGSWREYRSLARRDLLIALGAGAVLALHFWSWIMSISLTTVAASIVLVNLHPVVMVAGSALFLHEHPTRAQVSGIAVAMLGAVVVAYGDAGGTATAPNAFAGDLLALIGAATVGVYYLVGRSLRQRLSLWPYVGLVYGACLAVVLLLATITGVPLWSQPAREMWIFAGIALGPMMLGHTGFNWSLRHVPAYVVSLALLAEPVGATLLAAFLPGIAETPSPWTMTGGVVILVGLAVGTLGGARDAAPDPDIDPAPDPTDPRR
ncbi:MAG: DMT family transporter [Gemmatimonadetes bacterium]|nr:DMT family transporter [Gemmatimonadota bacterium]